jgi:predicted LPLAT superfamily acyltransferase
VNEEKQIRVIAEAARQAPKKVGAVVENHKAERFVRKLRAALPESGFTVEDVGQLTADTRAIIVKRKTPADPSSGKN